MMMLKEVLIVDLIKEMLLAALNGIIISCFSISICLGNKGEMIKALAISVSLIAVIIRCWSNWNFCAIIFRQKRY